MDENGMPGRIVNEWPEMSYTHLVSYFADGRRKEILEEGFNYTGHQYAYDATGNMVEKRGYYDGILDTMVIMSYEGQMLVDCYGTDAEGNVIYDTVVENGRITEKNYQDTDYAYGYNYEYDENGNLVAEYYKENGEAHQISMYEYTVVQVSWERAQYLQQQQQQLKSII
jgi:antitoxin component YwqK of YwqJK toxin-antitoxin module